MSLANWRISGRHLEESLVDFVNFADCKKLLNQGCVEVHGKKLKSL
jgi:hypothetical protein